MEIDDFGDCAARVPDDGQASIMDCARRANAAGASMLERLSLFARIGEIFAAAVLEHDSAPTIAEFMASRAGAEGGAG